MYYTEEELLEAVDILVEDYGFDEDEAIEMIAETYEMELYNEGIMDRTTIPSDITYNRMARAVKKVDKYKKINATKADKYRKKYNNLEGKFKSQIKKYNNYENKKLARYKARGKRPRTYSQISYKRDVDF